MQEKYAKLNYDPNTGMIVWRKTGKPAGTLRKNGYIQIGIDKRLYYAHRIAWAIFTGKEPKGQIDHIDGCKSNNRISNLRDVTPSINALNTCSPRSTNRTTKLQGVSQRTKTSWRALIGVNGKYKHLGVFKTPHEAHAAYLTEKRKIIGDYK